MCAVSQLINQWQNPQSPNYIDWPPKALPPPKVTPELAQQMLEVIQRLDAIDKKLGAMDCMLKEPEKNTVLNQLKARAKSRTKRRGKRK